MNMNSAFATLIFTVIALTSHSSALKNKRGCLDEKGKFARLHAPPECVTLVVPSQGCKPSREAPPFRVIAELDENNTVTVSLGNDNYGEGVPVSSLALTAENAKMPGKKAGNFVDLESFNKDDGMDVWCCDGRNNHNMITLEKEFGNSQDVNFRWSPGDYEGEVVFCATVTSGQQCFKYLCSRNVVIQKIRRLQV